MLSELITKFKGLFSAAFWFGNFLPVAIVAVLHLLLLEYAHPGTAPLEAWWNAETGTQFSRASLALFGLIIVAYSLTPFVPAVRDFLDGQSMPKRMHDWLRARRLEARKEKALRRPKETRLLGYLTHVAPRVEVTNDIGLQLDHPGTTAVRDAPGLDIVSAEIRRLRDLHARNDFIDATAFMNTYGALGRIVEQTNGANDPDKNEERINAPPVQAQIEELATVIRDLKADLIYRGKMFAPPPAREDIAATRIGEMRIFIESYSQRVYEVGFDYLWPRIQMLIGENDPTGKRLEEAQSQISFSILLLVLLQTVPLVWIPVFAAASDALAVAAVGVGAMFLIWFAYEMVVQSQLAFGRVVWTAIDKYRLKVLTDVTHQPAPQTLFAERKLWQALHDNYARGDAHDLFLEKAGAQ